jgi:hypothetical protein
MSIASAEICSIGAENSAPALAGARIGHFYRAGVEIYSVRAADCSGGARISAEMLQLGPTEHRWMSATSRGASPALEFARSMLEVARRRWWEHESSKFYRAGAEICSVRAADSSGEEESARNCSGQVQRSKVRCRRHRLGSSARQNSTAEQRGAQLK